MVRLGHNGGMKRKTLLHWAAATAAITLQLAPIQALAQTPAKPIRIIVPYAPGGPIDVTARLLAERVKDTLGTVIIENRPGGGGNIDGEVGKLEPGLRGHEREVEVVFEGLRRVGF